MSTFRTTITIDDHLSTVEVTYTMRDLGTIVPRILPLIESVQCAGIEMLELLDEDTARELTCRALVHEDSEREARQWSQRGDRAIEDNPL